MHHARTINNAARGCQQYFHHVPQLVQHLEPDASRHARFFRNALGVFLTFNNTLAGGHRAVQPACGAARHFPTFQRRRKARKAQKAQKARTREKMASLLLLADVTRRFTLGRLVDDDEPPAVDQPPVFPRFWPPKPNSAHPCDQEDVDSQAWLSEAPSSPQHDEFDAHCPPSTPPPTSASSKQPTLDAPTHCKEIKLPDRILNVKDAPSKKRKRERKKTERRREQCRINQARYRAKQKQLKMEAAERGIELSELTASTTTAAKKPKPRVKTERRLQQCRVNQARYREKQRAREQELERNVEQLKATIRRLERRRAELLSSKPEVK